MSPGHPLITWKPKLSPALRAGLGGAQAAALSRCGHHSSKGRGQAGKIGTEGSFLSLLMVGFKELGAGPVGPDPESHLVQVRVGGC